MGFHDAMVFYGWFMATLFGTFTVIFPIMLIGADRHTFLDGVKLAPVFGAFITAIGAVPAFIGVLLAMATAPYLQ